jgi:hypothetical protein
MGLFLLDELYGCWFGYHLCTSGELSHLGKLIYVILTFPLYLLYAALI